MERANTWRKLAILALLPMALSQGEAHALDVTVLGGGTLAVNSLSDATTSTYFSPKMSISYGALVGFGLIPGFGLEIGAINNTRSRKATTVGLAAMSAEAGYNYTDFSISYSAIQIPAMARFTLLPIVSVGVGGYYSLAPSGMEKTEATVEGIATSNESAAKDIYGSDFGAVADVRVGIPILPLFKMVVDARYNFGLKNVLKDSPEGEMKTRDLQVFAGLNFGF